MTAPTAYEIASAIDELQDAKDSYARYAYSRRSDAIIERLELAFTAFARLLARVPPEDKP